MIILMLFCCDGCNKILGEFSSLANSSLKLIQNPQFIVQIRIYYIHAMRKLSQRQLTEHVNLVKWEEHKRLDKFNMLTIHSLLLDKNQKFKDLKAKVETFNTMLAKGMERKHLQFQYTKKLYEMLRYLVNIKVYQRQQEFLEKVYAWAHGKMDNWEFDGFNQKDSISRPTTATTRTRPFSAYSRPKSGYNTNRLPLIKLEQPQPKIKQQKKTNPRIDYEKLKLDEVGFFTGQRTIHLDEQQPMMKLKQYRLKEVNWGLNAGSKVGDLKVEESEIMQLFKTEKKEQNKAKVIVQGERMVKGEMIMKGETIVKGEGEGMSKGEGIVQGEGIVKGEGQQNEIKGQINETNQPGDQQQQLQQGDDDFNNNIDQPAAEGQQQQQDQPQQIVDKLKPRYKAFIKYGTQLSKNQISYIKGKHHLLQQRNNLIRKVNEDDVQRMNMIEWAKEKSRTKREQKRRAESARIATKKIGIVYKEPVQEQEENVNVINLTSFPVGEIKNPRPKTAFQAFNESNRKQLIKNCFITGSMQGHVQKFQPPPGVTSNRDQRIVSLAQRPKKKTFQQILREAQMKVKEQQDEEILNVKQRFARSKVPVETNRIAKSITYHAGTADEEEYEEDDLVFGGGVVGINMMNNPFFKVGKKKKKKKKKK